MPRNKISEYHIFTYLKTINQLHMLSVVEGDKRDERKCVCNEMNREGREYSFSISRKFPEIYVEEIQEFEKHLALI